MMKVSQTQALPISSNYLGVTEFRTKFRELFAALRVSFSKVERLQSYQEPGVDSLDAFLRGDTALAHELLKKPMEGWDHMFTKVAQENLPWVRVRIVEFPLTPYLQWEFLTYQRSVKYGERILINDLSSESTASNLRNSRDFVMFDNAVVLAHDYGTAGVLQGAWLIDRDSDVRRYKEVFDDAVRTSAPLGIFEAQHKLPVL